MLLVCQSSKRTYRSIYLRNIYEKVPDPILPSQVPLDLGACTLKIRVFNIKKYTTTVLHFDQAVEEIQSSQ
jgi:hypothetical protein